MKLLDLFDKYFLILVVILGLIVGLHDSKEFKKSNLQSEYKLSKYIGLSMVGIAMVLFIINTIII